MANLQPLDIAALEKACSTALNLAGIERHHALRAIQREYHVDITLKTSYFGGEALTVRYANSVVLTMQTIGAPSDGAQD